MVDRDTVNIRFTQKERSTYNAERFEDMAPEIVYAEVVLLEI